MTAKVIVMAGSRRFMNTKSKRENKRYKQLIAPDVAVVRPEQEDLGSQIVTCPSVHYRRYVAENQEAIAYVAYQGWKKEGRGIVTLMPLWENNDPELAVLYVSAANLVKLPLLEPCLNADQFPFWYISLKELVRSQISNRLDTYNPHTEVVILGQVEDMSQVFPDEEIYQQIHRIEIFTFSNFKSSLQDCYEQFRGRATEFIF